MGEPITGSIIFADNPEETNTSIFRCAIPAKYLRQAGHNVDLVFHGSIDFRTMGENVLVERIVFPDSNNPDGIKLLRRAGAKRIVSTFDDAYHIMPDNMPSKGYWSEDRLKEFRKGLNMCDEVIVPSSRLAEDYGRFCNIRVVENFCDDEMWPIVEKKESEVITIGWGGSYGHLETWKKSKLLPAMKVIKQKYGKKVQFLLAGRISPTVIEEGIECGFIPGWVPFQQWANVVRSFDIGLAPLSGAYDLRRSKLRLEEYGLAGIPFAASKKGEYAKSVETHSGVGDWLCDTTDEWISALEALIDGGFDYRKSVGMLNRKWAEDYLMSKHVEDYVNVLSS